MALLPEIIKSLKRIAVGGGVASDDQRLTDSHLEYLVAKYRASGMEQLTQKRAYLDPAWEQEITLDLNRIDKAICSPIQSGCELKEGVIPKLVPLIDLRAVRYFGPVAENDNGWPVMDANDVHIMAMRRLTGARKPIAYIVGDKIRLEETISTATKYAKLRGIFMHPEKVQCTYDSTVQKCFDPDVDDYPVSGQLLEIITRSILTFELRIALETLSDEVNNTREDLRRAQYAKPKGGS